MSYNIKMLVEGLVKAANKAKKNQTLWGLKPEDKSYGAAKKGEPGFERQQAHQAKKGLKTKSQFAENEQELGNIIFEGLAKRIVGGIKAAASTAADNFVTKRQLDQDAEQGFANYHSYNGRGIPNSVVKATDDAITANKAFRKKNLVLAAAKGFMGRESKEAVKKARASRESTQERFESILLEAFAKHIIDNISEGGNPVNKAKKKELEIRKGIKKYDGGENSPRVAKAFGKAYKNLKGAPTAGDKVTAGSHAALKAKARESTDSDDVNDDEPTSSAYRADIRARIAAANAAKQPKPEVKKPYDPANTRAATLGKMGGYRDKKGQPVKAETPVGAENFKKNPASKPLPLNLKGSPSPGKKVNPEAVRGKSVNTSRSTGEEGNKAQASQDAFNRLYQKLGGNNPDKQTKRVKLMKGGNFKAKD